MWLGWWGSFHIFCELCIFNIHSVRTFFRMDSNMMGLRFPSGPGFFPGFGSDTRICFLIYFENYPVFSLLFSSSAIPLCSILWPYLITSAFIWSHLGVLLFFSVVTAFFYLCFSIWCFIFVGMMFRISIWESLLNFCLKKLLMILTCSSFVASPCLPSTGIVD